MKKILFVTKGCDQCDEGFSYVIEFASTLNKEIEVLIMQPKYQVSVMENLMAAVAYAEEGDLKSMNEMLKSSNTECIETLKERFRDLNIHCKSYSPDLLFHTAEGDEATAINSLLQDRPHLDMVMISPLLSGKTSSSHIKKLLKSITKPIVHISRPSAAGI